MKADPLRLSEVKVLAALAATSKPELIAVDIAAITGLNVATVRTALSYFRCSGGVICRTALRPYRWVITDNGRALITGAAYAEYITEYERR